MEKEEDSHLNPQPPVIVNRKTDEEFATIKPYTPPKQKKSSKCLVYVLLIVVLQSLAILIFGFVVLRIKAPRIRLSRVVVENLRYYSSQSFSSLNMTVVAEIWVHNQNFGRFRFHDGSVTLMYGNATVGATDISGGRVGRRERKRMNVTVGVIWVEHAALLSGNYVNLSRDINLGLVRLRSYGKLRGEVRVVKIVNRHRTAFTNCSMAVNLTSQAVQNLSCQ